LVLNRTTLVVSLNRLGVLVLRSVPLVLHTCLHVERVKSLVTRRAIVKNLPSMAETNPYPSGGAVAAEVAQLAASLLSAAADHSRDHWPEAGCARAQAQALRRRAARLAERGAGAYELAREALAQRAVAAIHGEADRDWRLGAALEQAADAPLELAANAADIAELAKEIARRAPDEVHADVVIAALFAAAAARAAAGLVAINLAVGGKQPAVVARRYAEAAATAAAAAEKPEF
jgi:formiminotetrahydrofolate cyclodeaminase